jgi:ankyrin repeat protein
LRTLETLPTTLEDTYARVLEQLPAEYLIDSIRILQVLTWSERPLRIDEAVDYLAVNLGSRKGFDIEDRMPDPGEIAKLCSSLITVVRYDQGAAKHFYDERAHDSQGGGASEELRLAHFSVKEYLRSNRLGDRYKIDLGQTTAAACIAKVSLTYLLNLEQGLDAMKIKSKFPLAGFSAAYWMQFSQISRDRDETVKALGLHMLSTREAFVRWLSIHDPDGPSGGAVQDNPLRSPHPLYYASLGGLVDTAHALIARGADVNVGGGYFGTNLQAACAKGHENVARILLDNGAKINARGCFYDWKTYREEQEISPLYTAVILNDSNLVKMLLGNGADMDAQGGRYGDVLQAACAEGYGDIVRILLDGCANVHAQGGQYMNALQAACTQGHWEVAEMLLANGADVNSPGGRYGNALQAACVRGHEKLLGILLTKGAKVNARGGEYGNALQAACAGGHEKAVKLLLSADADANAEGGSYGNALNAAYAGSFKRIAQMLLIQINSNRAASN